MFDTQRKFMRRPTQNGEYASICTGCFATVGSGKPPEDLDALEQKHVCDKETLRRLAAQSRIERREGR